MGIAMLRPHIWEEIELYCYIEIRLSWGLRVSPAIVGHTLAVQLLNYVTHKLLKINTRAVSGSRVLKNEYLP